MTNNTEFIAPQKMIKRPLKNIDNVITMNILTKFINYFAQRPHNINRLKLAYNIEESNQTIGGILRLSTIMFYERKQYPALLLYPNKIWWVPTIEIGLPINENSNKDIFITYNGPLHDTEKVVGSKTPIENIIKFFNATNDGLNFIVEQDQPKRALLTAQQFKKYLSDNKYNIVKPPILPHELKIQKIRGII